MADDKRSALNPHPIFSALGSGSTGEAVAVLEGIVCPGEPGTVVLTAGFKDITTRFVINKIDVLYTEAVGDAAEHRVRIAVKEAAEILAITAQKRAAIEVEQDLIGQPELAAADFAAALISGGGSTGSLDCYTRCNREKRRCEGLFPSEERKRVCAEKYEKCRQGCGSGSLGGGGVVIA
jgi:hypothetical protein